MFEHKYDVVCSFGETPKGEFLLVISFSCFRVRVHSVCLCTLLLSEVKVKGCLLADLVGFIGTVDIVLGDVDR